MARNFQTDFLIPAIEGLSKKHALRVSAALAAAICFGMLEAADGNASLQDRASVEAKYADNVRRLKYGGPFGTQAGN